MGILEGLGGLPLTAELRLEEDPWLFGSWGITGSWLGVAGVVGGGEVVAKRSGEGPCSRGELAGVPLGRAGHRDWWTLHPARAKKGLAQWAQRKPTFFLCTCLMCWRREVVVVSPL